MMCQFVETSCLDDLADAYSAMNRINRHVSTPMTANRPQNEIGESLTNDVILQTLLVVVVVVGGDGDEEEVSLTLEDGFV